jgi:hypothetical protein
MRCNTEELQPLVVQFVINGRLKSRFPSVFLYHSIYFHDVMHRSSRPLGSSSPVFSLLLAFGVGGTTQHTV